MAKWFYVVDGQATGPIDSASLKSLADSGLLKPDDKVRRDDLDKWVRAKQVQGLFALGEPPAASQQVRSLESAISESPSHLKNSEDKVSKLPVEQTNIGSGTKVTGAAFSLPHTIVSAGSKASIKSSRRFKVLIVALCIVGCFVLGLAVATPLLLNRGSSDLNKSAMVAKEPNTFANETGEKVLGNANSAIEHQSTAEPHPAETAVTSLLPATPPLVPPSTTTAPAANNQDDLTVPAGPPDVVDVTKFLETYRRLRKAPQLKLRDYTDAPTVEWRCLIHGTSLTGMPWVFAHLPSSKPEEVELMIFTADKGLPNRIWPILNDRKAQGLEPYLEVTVRGDHIGVRPAVPGESPPRVELGNALVTEVDPAMSVHTSAGAKKQDVSAAAKFLDDWKKSDKDDPDGSYWLNRQMKEAGYLQKVVRWRCVLHEYGDNIDANLYNADQTDPKVSFSKEEYRDFIEKLVGKATYDHWMAAFNAGGSRNLKLPSREMIVEGKFELMMSDNATVILSDAKLFKIDTHEKAESITGSPDVNQAATETAQAETSTSLEKASGIPSRLMTWPVGGLNSDIETRIARDMESKRSGKKWGTDSAGRDGSVWPKDALELPSTIESLYLLKEFGDEYQKACQSGNRSDEDRYAGLVDSELATIDVSAYAQVQERFESRIGPMPRYDQCVVTTWALRKNIDDLERSVAITKSQTMKARYSKQLEIKQKALPQIENFVRILEESPRARDLSAGKSSTAEAQKADRLFFESRTSREAAMAYDVQQAKLKWPEIQSIVIGSRTPTLSLPVAIRSLRILVDVAPSDVPIEEVKTSLATLNKIYRIKRTTNDGRQRPK